MPRMLERTLSASAAVGIAIVAGDVDLDDEVQLADMDIDDAICRIRERLLEPIGNPESISG